jgi:hypothetical protein
MGNKDSDLNLKIKVFKFITIDELNEIITKIKQTQHFDSVSYVINQLPVCVNFKWCEIPYRYEIIDYYKSTHLSLNQLKDFKDKKNIKIGLTKLQYEFLFFGKVQ